MLLLRMAGGDRGGVEQAKAHRLRRLRMVAGRAHGAKGVLRLALHDHSRQRGARRRSPHRRLPRTGRDGGVHVDARQAFARNSACGSPRCIARDDRAGQPRVQPSGASMRFSAAKSGCRAPHAMRANDPAARDARPESNDQGMRVVQEKGGHTKVRRGQRCIWPREVCGVNPRRLLRVSQRLAIRQATV